MINLLTYSLFLPITHDTLAEVEWSLSAALWQPATR